jgi:hypothetical protein
MSLSHALEFDIASYNRCIIEVNNTEIGAV